MENQNLKNFTAAYIEALYFTAPEDVTERLIRPELSEQARLDIEADCRSFWRRFGPYITSETCLDAFDDPVKQAGHDFHLTRNGHGAGFWENEWPQPYRDMLTKAAQSYGELHADIDDINLKIYVF